MLEKAERGKYNGADTFLQRQPFNYNRCLNEGVRMGNAEFICFTNNNVLFPEDFVKRIVLMQEGEYDVLSVKNQDGYLHH